MTFPTDSQLREFLLQRLGPAESARLEEAILLEDNVAERLRVEEFDLLDDYAAGRLGVAERSGVERHLLGSAASRHSLRVAALIAREQTTRRRRRSVRPARFVALMAAAVLAGVILIPRWAMVPSAPPAVLSDGPAADPAPARPAPMEPESSLPTFSLLAEVTRGAAGAPAAEVVALHWKAGVPAARLQLEVRDSGSTGRYVVRVADRAGRVSFTSPVLPAQQAGIYHFVETVVPTTVLGPGPRSVSIHAADGGAVSAPVFTWQVLGVTD